MGFVQERVIKFRDYDFETKIIRHFDLDSYNKYEHDSYGNITQFTGLQDKNGVDIYEGDLIQLFGDNNGSLLVEFKNQYVGGWVLTYKGDELSLGARRREDLLVIGNIYENEAIQNIL